MHIMYFRNWVKKINYIILKLKKYVFIVLSQVVIIIIHIIYSLYKLNLMQV